MTIAAALGLLFFAAPAAASTGGAFPAAGSPPPPGSPSGTPAAEAPKPAAVVPTASPLALETTAKQALILDYNTGTILFEMTTGQLPFTGGLAHLAQPSRFFAWRKELYGREWNIYCKPPCGGAERERPADER